MESQQTHWKKPRKQCFGAQRLAEQMSHAQVEPGIYCCR